MIDRFEGLFEDEFEDAVRDGVRQYLDDNSESLADVVRGAMVEIAQRGDELHTLSRDDRDLVIEHFDPSQRNEPAIPFPRPRVRPVGEPIDGPLDGDADARLAEIDHIVVVMMENRSFDHMLGFLSHPTAHPASGRRLDIDGLSGAERLDLGDDVTGPGQAPAFAPQREWRPDPDHSFNGALLQIGGGAMDGFIPSFRGRVRTAPEIDVAGPLADERRIANCQPASSVPILEYLADQFCVLDRWFSSFPGATFPNRMCGLTGVTRALTNGELIPALGYLDELTLFDLLDRANVRWRLYEGDVSFLRTFDRYRLNFADVRPWSEFRDGGSDPLPPVTFVDPNVTGLPSEDHANDDHPPTDVAFGQVFLQQVLDRVQASESWPTTMVIITYDEHGGLYDHVAPPGTPRFQQANSDVDTALPSVHPQALTYGVRVPTFVVSPRVASASVGHRIYDHATIIRTVLERFAPRQIGLMPERVRRARHLGEILTTISRTNIEPPPRLDSPDARRLRMDRFIPGLDLSSRERDPEDFREIMARFGSPRFE
ncbi:MAG: hypothetical protein H0U21_00935 [Acidimicrobiia bacterium]|nr:hypothetical protein [Acidimicrobiia bacterium]